MGWNDLIREPCSYSLEIGASGRHRAEAFVNPDAIATKVQPRTQDYQNHRGKKQRPHCSLPNGSGYNLPPAPEVGKGQKKARDGEGIRVSSLEQANTNSGLRRSVMRSSHKGVKVRFCPRFSSRPNGPVR